MPSVPDLCSLQYEHLDVIVQRDLKRPGGVGKSAQRCVVEEGSFCADVIGTLQSVFPGCDESSKDGKFSGEIFLAVAKKDTVKYQLHSVPTGQGERLRDLVELRGRGTALSFFSLTHSSMSLTLPLAGAHDSSLIVRGAMKRDITGFLPECTIALVYTPNDEDDGDRDPKLMDIQDIIVQVIAL